MIKANGEYKPSKDGRGFIFERDALLSLSVSSIFIWISCLDRHIMRSKMFTITPTATTAATVYQSARAYARFSIILGDYKQY